jgi:hypothetical protein
LGAEDGELVNEDVEDMSDLALMLEALDSQLSEGLNFEFMAALLRLALEVHGAAIAARPLLRRVATRIRKHLAPRWARLSNLLGDVQCMAGYAANILQ